MFINKNTVDEVVDAILAVTGLCLGALIIVPTFFVAFFGFIYFVLHFTWIFLTLLLAIVLFAAAWKIWREMLDKG